MNVSGRLTPPPTNTPINATPLRSGVADDSLHKTVVGILCDIDGDRPGCDRMAVELAALARHRSLAEAELRGYTCEWQMLLDAHLPRSARHLSALADVEEARDWGRTVERLRGGRPSPELAAAHAASRKMGEMAVTLGAEVEADRARVDAAAAQRDRALARANTITERLAALRGAMKVFTEAEANAFATVLLALPAGEFRESAMSQGLAAHGLCADWLHARLEFVDVWVAIEARGLLRDISVFRSAAGHCEIPLDTLDKRELRRIEVCTTGAGPAGGQTLILAPQGVPVGTYDDPETLNTLVVVQSGRLREAWPIARFAEAAASSAR